MISSSRQLFEVDPTHIAAHDVNELHKAVSWLFRTESGTSDDFRAKHNILFYANRKAATSNASRATLGQALTVLVQSDEPAINSSHVLVPASAPFKVNHEVPEGVVLDFRICINPTVSKKEPGMMRGKRRPITNPSDVQTWMESQLTRAGAELTENMIIGPPQRNAGTSRPITLRHVAGRLVVTDSERFAAARRAGFGRAKAYGAGLLMTKVADA